MPPEPSASRWDRVVARLEEAIALPPGEREAYLSRLPDEPEIRDEVLSLLAVETPPSDILEHPVLEWYRIEAGSNDASASLPRLLCGEVLAGRFRIRAFIGRGGMGEVYSAEDAELGETVALKLLHPDLAAQPAFLDRFRREIRLARRISHPNVARVFDLVREPHHPLGALNFYIMELLDGETLSARIARGAIPEAEALALARQLAAGLHAAHAAYVIHRDFKPSNVLLPGGRPVITDFGLAAPILYGAGEANVKTTSLQLGTPGFIAPEQWAGKPVTVASDVYSFGVVLHQMVTGVHPNEPGPSPPAAWALSIHKCLELDPRNRWRTPVEAVAAIEHRSLSRRLLLRSGAAAAAVSLGAFGLRQWWMKAGIPRVTRMVLADVQNATGDGRFDGATELLFAQLNQSPQLHLVGRDERAVLLAQMGLPANLKLDAPRTREMAWRAKTPAILFATVSAVGSDYVLQLRLETLNGRPDSRGATASRSFQAGGPQDLLRQFRAAATWARAAAGEAAAQIAASDRPPEEVTTGSWEALAAYTQARYSQWHEEQAEQYLKEALAADPGFVAAQQGLADLYISRARYAEGYAQWEKAMRLLESRQVTFRERYRLESLYYEDTFQRDKQLASVRAWSIHYPDDEPAQFFLASALFHLSQFDEALRAFDAAWRIEPLPRTASYAAAAGWMKQDAAVTDRWIAILSKQSDPGLYWKLSGQTAFLRGNYETSRDAFTRLAGHADLDPRDQGRALLTCLYAEAGRADLALANCAAHVTEARSWGRPAILARRLLQLAYLRILARDPGRSYTALEEAEQFEKSPRTMKDAATVYRLAGDRAAIARLQSETASWPDIPVFTASRTWIEAELVCTTRGPAAAREVYIAALRPASRYVWPRIAVGAALDLNPYPPGVPLASALWLMAPRHWPGLLRASGALGGTQPGLDRFGGSLHSI